MDLLPLTENRKKELQSCDGVLSGSVPRLFVLGRNAYSTRVASHLRIEGVVDDYAGAGVWNGLPVVSMNQVPKDGTVISCVVDGRPLTALNRLRQFGVKQAVDYFSLVFRDPVRFGPLTFCSLDRSVIANNLSRYARVWNWLEDQVSKEHFAKVINFRYSLDPAVMEGIPYRVEMQYFEPFIRMAPGDVFIDGGGFDGSTTLKYTDINPGYRKVYYCEPSAEQMALSIGKLQNRPGIEFVSAGLYSRPDTLRFARGGSTSRLADDGEVVVSVDTLDRLVPERIAFCKLDVEGAELAALSGGVHHIENDEMAVAVCTYHSDDDYWRIADFMKQIRPNDKVYFRHYTEGLFESVMFFVPPSAFRG